MQTVVKPVTLLFSGQETERVDMLPESAEEVKAIAYKIPPVVWVALFLGLGYIGVRLTMED